MDDNEQGFRAIEHALKRAAAALRDADVPFLLGGSLASWARGGPETDHDLDLMIKPEDAERALDALTQAGMRPEDPPEEWLLKAWDGDVLVDLIFAPKGLEITDEVIARGGPETDHDLDLMIKPEDAERGLDALVAAGMRPEDPPEEWLVKAWDGDVLVDLIFAPKGLEMTDEVIARGEEMAVLSMEMRVMALEDVLVTKLMALSEHALRYESLLRISRALREQVDWDAVRARTEGSPFARAFFVLAEGLGVLPESPVREEGAAHRTRVRVLTPPGCDAPDEG
jgi:hypothetical protein